MQFIIGSWYRKDELAKRTCIFHVSSVLGAMFSGYLMAAIYHLGGVGGYKGWQWSVNRLISKKAWTNISRLFIIDGAISLVIAISGFWMIPDIPEIADPWFLSKDVSFINRNYPLANLRSGYCTCKTTNGTGRA
jgi:ACS family pantothenate transporter-like MFS transporter